MGIEIHYRARHIDCNCFGHDALVVTSFRCMSPHGQLPGIGLSIRWEEKGDMIIFGEIELIAI